MLAFFSSSTLALDFHVANQTAFIQEYLLQIFNLRYFFGALISSLGPPLAEREGTFVSKEHWTKFTDRAQSH